MNRAGEGLARAVGDRQFEQLHASMTRVEARIDHIDEQIPDPDAPSPIEKAKDALLGDHERTEE